jgi:C4-dicarboxylate-specific signal transduction histidine kinase
MEKELALRFGEQYLNCKQSNPFLFPDLNKINIKANVDKLQTNCLVLVLRRELSKNMLEKNNKEKKKILVVEDNRVDAEVIRLHLKESYRVTVLESAVEALLAAAKESFDLILLDVIMPEMNGYELCKRLKADKRIQATPIIFLTSLEADTDEIKGFDAGAEDYIRKPVRKEILKKRVKHHLELMEYRIFLEELVQERTGEILEINKQLEKSNIHLKNEIEDRKRTEYALDKTSQALGNDLVELVEKETILTSSIMARGIAHEFSQPLCTIKIVCQGVLRDLEKDRFEEKMLANDFEQILSMVSKLTGIIDSMHSYCHSSFAGNNVNSSVNDVISSAFGFLEQQFHSHAIKIEKELTTGLALVGMDPVLLQQTLLKLLVNAQESVEESGHNMWISIKSRKGKLGEVVVEIEDSGNGVAENIRTKIFQPFFSTKRPRTGLGFGLHIARKNLESVGGRIEYQTAKDGGANFMITIPEYGTK